LLIDELPIYQPNSDFVYQLSNEQYLEMEKIFKKMDAELSSDYAYKYDLLRNYVLELIHTGQKLKPMESVHTTTNAASRISSLFIELLERQFPIENNDDREQEHGAQASPARFAVMTGMGLVRVHDTNPRRIPAVVQSVTIALRSAVGVCYDSRG